MGEAGRVDVWIVPSPSPATDVLADVLDDVERERAAGMDPSRRAAFVTARVLLRAAVAHRLGGAPADLLLDATCRCGHAHGPVSILPTGPWVSISRNGPAVAVALRESGPVGLDLASVAAVAAAPLTRLLPPGAHHRDPDRPAATRGGEARSLARTWVRTEATLKMLRTGLRRDPADLRVDEQGHAHLDGRRGGRVLDLPPQPGALGADSDAVGAVAVDTSSPIDVRLHDATRLLDALLAAGRPAQPAE